MSKLKFKSNNQWIKSQHDWLGIDYSIIRRCLRHTYNNRYSAEYLLYYISTGLCPSCPEDSTGKTGCKEDCNCLYKDGLEMEYQHLLNEIASQSEKAG